MQSKKIVILGAGPSGLTIALELIDKGFDVTLIESSSEVGGLCRTVKKNNISFDIGPHGLSPSIPKVIEKIKALLGKDLLEKENLHGIHFDNITYKYPPQLADFFKFSPVKNGVLFLGSLLNTKIKNFFIKESKEDNSFDSILINRFGKKFCEDLIFPLTLKAWGTRDLHPNFVRIRMTIPSFSQIFKKLFIKDLVINNNTTYYYPVNGFGQIFNVMADRLITGGQKIEFNCNILSIQAETLQGPYKVLYTQNNENKELEADIVVSTIPNKNLFNYLSGTGLIEPVLEEIDSFPSRNMRLGIMLVKNFSLPYKVIFFPESKFAFNRVSDMAHYADLGNPENHAILMFDFINSPDNDYERMEEAEFKKQLVNSVMKLKWFEEKDIVEIFSQNFEYVYPVMNIKRYNAQKKIDGFFKDTNIILCGREASSDYNNAHNAMAKAIETASYIAGEISLDEYIKISEELGRMPIGE